MTNLLERFLKKLSVRHTNKYTNNVYNEHPYKYTLYGLGQMLSRYKIENEALKLEKKDELLQLQTPFIAQAAHDIVIVKSLSDKEVVYDWYGDDIKIDFSKFKDIFTGVVLLAYPNEKSSEPNYKEHHCMEMLEKSEWSVIGLSVFLSACYLFFENEVYGDVPLVLSSLLGLLGAYLSYLIIQKTLHVESKAADRLCSVFKKSTCNNVLETPAAKLFGRYGWGQIGLAYFSVNLIAAFSLPSFASKYLPIVSICALPYPIWSIWYQKVKVRSWCPLCLFIQLIILIQGVLGIFSLISSTATFHDYIDSTIFFLFVGYLAFTLLLCKFSRLYAKASEANEWKAKLALLKYRKDIIEKMFDSMPNHDNSETASRIIFGKKESPYRVTVFSNPYCNPCASMHKKIEELYAAGCQIQYVFTYFSEDLSMVNKLMMASYEQRGEEHTWKLLSAWYDGGKSQQEKFFSSELDTETLFVKEEFNNHGRWKNLTGFNATPTLLFNGKEMPDSYNTQDLLFIVTNGL